MEHAMTTRAYAPLTDADFEQAFPSSRKVYVDGPAGVRVPMREIGLSAGEPALRVYDSSGPRGFGVDTGLPALRREWIIEREDVTERGPGAPGFRSAGVRASTLRAKPGCAPTQLHYARRGTV